jgi:CheY-like chemotaxis protein
MDATSAEFEIPREDFLRKLADSQLVPPDELERLSEAHPGAVGLAHALISGGLLTEFQLMAVTQGRLNELRIGNYDILGRLGSGGMGSVFLARHRRMKRVVALKVLAPELSQDASFVHRFQREVETIARLGHPNIVMAYDADEAEAGHFLVMEYVKGRDLASVVEKSGPMAPAEALGCILQAARGLAYAHSQGIIHRDIKPANLLYDENQSIKITDLGLARLSNPKTGTAASSITQAGGLLGTANYMPPEQAADPAAADARADIYALGCTLHYLLTGSPPYTATSLMGVLVKHQCAPIPSLRAAVPGLPDQVDAIFQKMLGKAPEERYQAMTEVVAALEGLAVPQGPATSVPPVPRPSADPASASTATGRGLQSTRVTAPAAFSVLIVEPSRVQAAIIRKYLQAQDVAVAGHATNGMEALAMIGETRPSAIVSALYLDDLPGTELARRARADYPDSPPGFVLVSTASEAEGASLSKLGNVLMLHKPFTPQQLIDALGMVTGRAIALKSDVSVALPSRPSAQGLAVAVDRSKVKVLIVDDSSAARAHEKAVLKSLGFADFTEAEDGAHAIAAVARERYGLIVTDYNMPLMDGHALVSYLRQSPTTARTPILMVTTESSPAALGPVRALGVEGVFEKAFPTAAVQAVLDRLF